MHKRLLRALNNLGLRRGYLNQLTSDDSLLAHDRNLLRLLLADSHGHHLRLLLLRRLDWRQLTELCKLVRLEAVGRWNRDRGRYWRRLNGRRLRRSERLELRLLRVHRGSVGPGHRLHHPHEDACLRAVALRLHSDQADEDLEGSVRSRDGVAGDLAVARERVETLEGADEQVDVVEGQVGDELVVDRALV